MPDLQAEIIKIPNTTLIREKHWYRPVLLVAGTIFFGTLCFGLGRLSKIEENAPELVIDEPDQTAQTIQTVQTSQTISKTNSNSTLKPRTSSLPSTSGGGGSSKGGYVASKNGTKYYLPNCAGVARINEANKVWFQTKAEAEARGLTPAANCPGL